MLLLNLLPRICTCFLVGVIKYFEVVGKYHEVIIHVRWFYAYILFPKKCFTNKTHFLETCLFYMAVQKILVAFLKINFLCFRTQYAGLISAIIHMVKVESTNT